MDIDQIKNSVETAIREVTDNGRFVIFAYAPSPKSHSAVLIGTTTRRSYGQVLLRIEHLYPGRPVHAGSRMDPSLLESLTRNAVGMRTHDVDLPGFDATETGIWVLFGEIIARYMPRRWTHRGFALFDISGFSEDPTEVQLTKRLMLDGALLWARSVVGKYFASCSEKPSQRYSRISTGDGYYVWSTRPGPIEDASTFAMMLLTMAYVRVRERWDREWEIRSAFTVGKAITLPYFGPWAAVEADYLVEDAVGPALNGLARILARAAPSQVLIGDFSVDDPNYPRWFANPQGLISLITTLVPELAKPLELLPSEKLRIMDKHGDAYHFFNVSGRVETRDETLKDLMQNVGVVPDTAKEFGSFVFGR